MIHTNQKHPFLTLEQGFLPVGQLKLGMHLLRADGRVGVVTGWKMVPGIQVMYNLEVAQDHTFTVGAGQWVVHNCASGPPQEESGQWVHVNESMSERAAQYQTQITGREPGWAYNVNSVKFDGYWDGVLLEAKGPGYQGLFERLGNKPFFQGLDSMIEQANNQVIAAGDVPIEWHVAEEGAANVIRNAFSARGYSINVIWTPPNF